MFQHHLLGRSLLLFSFLGVLAALTTWAVSAPPVTAQQPGAEDVCIARWEWVEEPDGLSNWQAPFVANNTGVLDLRSVPQMGQAGPLAAGWGLFAYDQPMGSTGMHCLGGDISASLSTTEQNTVRLILGLSADASRSQSISSFVRNLFVQDADPTGQSRWKPVRISPKSGFQIDLGGFGLITAESFSQSHPAFQNTLDVRWADYRRNAEAGISQVALEKWTGFDMLKYEGRRGDDLLSKYVPPEYLDGTKGSHGQREPATTWGDTFTDTDGTSLDAHTPTGPNAGSGWTEVEGTALQINSNLLTTTSTSGTVSARMDDSLSSDDHYAQADVDISNDTSNDPKIGMAVRYAAAATTYYFGNARQNTSFSFRIYKVVTGTPTLLATDTEVAAPTAGLFKVEVDGSDLELFWDGVSKLTVSDTAITGNLQGGLWRESGINRTSTWDNFEEADLAAAPTRRVIVIGWLGQFLLGQQWLHSPSLGGVYEILVHESKTNDPEKAGRHILPVGPARADAGGGHVALLVCHWPPGREPVQGDSSAVYSHS